MRRLQVNTIQVEPVRAEAHTCGLPEDLQVAVVASIPLRQPVEAAAHAAVVAAPSIINSNFPISAA